AAYGIPLNAATPSVTWPRSWPYRVATTRLPAAMLMTAPSYGRSAGRVDRLPGHEAGVVAAEEGDHAGNVLRLADAPQRDPFGGGLFQIRVVNPGAFGDRLRHPRLDEPGCDRVDVDVEGAQLDRQRPRDSLDAGLRRRIIDLPTVTQRGVG